MCTSLGFNGQFSYILLDYIIVSLLKLSFDYKENSYVHFTLHHLQPIEQRGYFQGFKYVLIWIFISYYFLFYFLVCVSLFF